MDNLVWKRVRPLTQGNSIEKFQEENGITVPEELKNCILINNGGRPSLDIINTSDGNELEVKALLSFNKEDLENIYDVIGYFKEEYKGKLLPFATESSGDYFCVNSDNNSIVYWNHETNELTFIANGLVEFLNCLHKL